MPNPTAINHFFFLFATLTHHVPSPPGKTLAIGCFKEVNGGFLQVENGSEARFLKNLEVAGFRVKCSRDEDFCDEIFDGGCVWNEVG